MGEHAANKRFSPNEPNFAHKSPGISGLARSKRTQFRTQLHPDKAHVDDSLDARIGAPERTLRRAVANAKTAAVS
jgi:hypothetical protein